MSLSAGSVVYLKDEGAPLPLKAVVLRRHDDEGGAAFSIDVVLAESGEIRKRVPGAGLPRGAAPAPDGVHVGCCVLRVIDDLRFPAVVWRVADDGSTASVVFLDGAPARQPTCAAAAHPCAPRTRPHRRQGGA